MAREEFVRVPPDSTGKRIHSSRHYSLSYEAGTIDFVVGLSITGINSGASGTIMYVDGNTSSGVLYIQKNDESLNFIVGEDLEVSSVRYAQVKTGDVEVFNQVVQIGDALNPHNRVFVDDQGSMQIRYSEGEQQLDAAGLSRSSNPTLMGEYFCDYDDLSDLFTNSAAGSGTITFIPDEAAVNLAVGTSASDSAIRITDRYHIYQPGFGQTIMMTVVNGDAGKANNKRRWGYFDGYDGLFFELDGTTLYAVVRSSSTGSVVESRVAQSSWNRDRLDGSGGTGNLSSVELDITNVNLYWIDFLWLGIGRVRFGIYGKDGTRITAHAFEHANSRNTVYMSRPNLPIRFENENTGVTISGSELKVICSSVMNDGNVVDARAKQSDKFGGMSALVTVPDGYYTPITSFRATRFINGLRNRKISLPEFFSFRVKDSDVQLVILKNGVLVGDVWSVYNDSSLEIDGYATSVSGGKMLLSWILEPGVTQLDAPSNFGYYSENASLKGDGSYGDHYTMAAMCLEPGQTARVQVSVTWIDI